MRHNVGLAVIGRSDGLVDLSWREDGAMWASLGVSREAARIAVDVALYLDERYGGVEWVLMTKSRKPA
jgi:hypothetical protein